MGKHHKILMLAGLLVLTFLLTPHLVHAAPTPTPSPAPTASDQNLGPFLDGASQVVKFLQTLLWPVLMMIGSLMQNDILFGAGMEGRLLEIWVNVRNIVNIFFVLILLGIALYNVVGAGENYHIKTILPKFVIGLIAVNFTFVGLKFALDAINVVATAMFALPQSVQAELTANSNNTSSSTPMVGIFTVAEANGMCGAQFGGVDGNALASDPNAQITYNNAVAAAATQNPGQPTMCDQYPPPSQQASLLDPGSVSAFSQMTSRNAAMVMAIALGKTNLLDKVYLDPRSQISAGKLFVNVMLSIVLYVVYGTAFIALFVALLLRLVALWVMIALSPLMVLPYVVPAIKDKLGEGGDLAGKFIQNAIMPIIVGVVMSIGYVMLRGLQSASITTDQFLKSPTLSLNLLTSGITTLQQLIVALGMVAFVWVGVFQAFKGTYAEGITGAIDNAVKGAGQTLTKFALGSIPLFPTGRVGKDGKQIVANASDVGLAVKAVPGVIENKQREHFKETMPGLAGDDHALIKNIGTSKNWAEYSQHANAISKSSLGQKAFQNNTETSIKGSPEVKAKFQDAARDYISADGKRKGFDAFMKDLHDGTVTEDSMENILRKTGIQPGSVSPLATPKSASAAAMQASLSPMEKDLLDPSKRKNFNLTDQQKKDLDRIKKDLDNAKQNPGAAQKAKTDLDQLAMALEGPKANAEADIKFTIGKNAGLDATPENAKTIETTLQQRVDQLAAGKPKDSKEYKEAEKKVLDMAAGDLTEMAKNNKANVDHLSTVTEGGSAPLLRRALDQQAGKAPPAAAPTPKEPKPSARTGNEAKDIGATSPKGEWLWNGTDWSPKPSAPPTSPKK